MARALPILIVLLPVLLTLSYVYSFALETPWQDDWDLYMVPFQHQAAGQLTWSDVTAQHNESIPIFPTAASLILARIFGGLLLPVTYLSYLCLCGSVLILYLFFRQLRLPGRWSTLWFLPIALLFLGWRQSEALLWSTHLLNSMALFFVLASLYCCTQAGRAPIFFAGAVLCAWIASFSMASGLLVWFSGAVALAFPPAGKARSTDIVRRVAGWLAIAATCALCFFMGYTANHASWPTGLDYVLANAGSAAQYILIYLGGPLGAKPSIAKVAGEVLLAIGLAILVFAWRRIREKGFPRPAPTVPLCLHGGISVGERPFGTRHRTILRTAICDSGGSILDRHLSLLFGAGQNDPRVPLPLHWNGSAVELRDRKLLRIRDRDRTQGVADPKRLRGGYQIVSRRGPPAVGHVLPGSEYHQRARSCDGRVSHQPVRRVSSATLLNL
ncbi:MAG: hypothetical protein WDO73_22090 [Ignavibacteriota bacterium]